MKKLLIVLAIVLFVFACVSLDVTFRGPCESWLVRGDTMAQDTLYKLHVDSLVCPKQ